LVDGRHLLSAGPIHILEQAAQTQSCRRFTVLCLQLACIDSLCSSWHTDLKAKA
jgi:hypothetical protein